jgi:Rhamnan synthesis protein F
LNLPTGPTIQPSFYMIPAWKWRRELGRVGQQLKGLLDRLTDPIQQRRLDRVVANGLFRLDGAVPASKKTAIVLVFQPKRIADSILLTCRWLASSGYAPLVVSNAPISQQDRERLSEVVWRAVERPNFGYDFGGYRDGLTCLAQWATVPEELLILNDSIWLPLEPNTDLLHRLSNHPADIVGTILRTRGSEQFVESYIYRLGPSALRHPSFSAFWQQIRLTSNKYHVIRRGERGFSAAMQSAGLQVASIFDDAEFVRLIAQQDSVFLRKMLEHAAYIDRSLAAEREQLLKKSGPRWRDQVLLHVDKVLSKRLAYSSFPYAMVQLMGYPLLKKSAEPVSKAWRQAYVAAVKAKDLPLPPAPIWSEIIARDGVT